jgi:hypothetical protein
MNNSQLRIGVSGRIEVMHAKLYLDLQLNNMSPDLISQVSVNLSQNYFGLAVVDGNPTSMMVPQGNTAPLKKELAKGVNLGAVTALEGFTPYSVVCNMTINGAPASFNVPFPLHFILVNFLGNNNRMPVEKLMLKNSRPVG